MSYEKLKSLDGIEFIPLREPEQANIETEQEQIDIEAQNILEDKQTTSTITCCICLENNDKTSIKLKCRCGTKIHSACIEEMKKNNITKCPMCSDTIMKKVQKEQSIIKQIINFIISIFIITSFFTYIVEIFYILPNVIFFPSERKYCDNVYQKCEYFQVSGILINNTIDVRINDFIPQYNLISTYQYENRGLNKTCVGEDYHTYSSYEDVVIVEKLIINTDKKIFVSNSDNSSCKDKYKYYNTQMIYSQILGTVNLFFLILMGLFGELYKCLKNNNTNIIILNLCLMFVRIKSIIVGVSSLGFTYFMANVIWNS